MENKEQYYKFKFIAYFDGYGYGCYGETAQPDVPSTFQMGVCKLEYIEKENKLMVSLRRPGLLIGKGGQTINSLKNYLGIEVGITEISLMK